MVSWHSLARSWCMGIHRQNTVLSPCLNDKIQRQNWKCNYILLLSSDGLKYYQVFGSFGFVLCLDRILSTFLQNKICTKSIREERLAGRTCCKPAVSKLHIAILSAETVKGLLHALVETSTHWAQWLTQVQTGISGIHLNEVQLYMWWPPFVKQLKLRSTRDEKSHTKRPRTSPPHYYFILLWSQDSS